MKKRVLVVEDYEDTRVLLKFMIEKFGYSVIEAFGPYDAIDKAAEFLPDLILMDIGMPLLDGLSSPNSSTTKKQTVSCRSSRSPRLATSRTKR